jgi:radical SAM superfamily enzyme YgiQ (UPF0313 family)
MQGAVQMPKLVLVNPMQPGAVSFRANTRTNFPPLNLAYVAAYTPEHWDIEIVDENIEEFRLASADLVGVTAFTMAAPRAYEVAAQYREQGVPVVMGGVHASMVPDEASEYCDTVVVGEAEPVWETVCRDFESGGLARRYFGGHADLRGLRRPRRDLLSDRYYLGTIQTARGCPFDCDFCSVTAFNGQRYRQRPVDEVLDELATIPNRRIVFADDNIFGYGKRSHERAAALFQGMVARKLDRGWSTQASINIARHEECLRWARRSGCTTLMVGLESLKAETLRRMGKQHQTGDVADGYARAMDVIRRSGIGVFGTIILGHDSDDLEVAERTCEFMVNRGPDVGVCTILTPLPGTRLHARLSAEGRIAKDDYPADWALYDINEVVFRPNRLTMKELKECQVYIHERLWGRGQVFWATLRTLRATGSPAAAIVANRLNCAFRSTHRLRKTHREAVGIEAPAVLGEKTPAGAGAPVAEQPAPQEALRQRTY